MKGKTFLSTSTSPDRAYLRNFSAQAGARRGEYPKRESQPAPRKKSTGKMKLFEVGMGIDMPFLLIVLLLLAIGILMMFSASYPVALAEEGNSYYYLVRQTIFAVIGVSIMIFVSFINYHWFYRFAVFIAGLAIFLLIIVIPLTWGQDLHRWIPLGIVDLQPSEVAKFAVIVFFAYWGAKYHDKMKYMKYSLLPGLIAFGTLAVLLVLEPHYSGIVIMFCLILFMLWFAGMSPVYFFYIIGFGVVAVLIAYVTGVLGYAMERMDGWGQALSCSPYDYDMWWATWQTRNSLYAIGSGGLTGLGLGKSRQKYLYLPEPQNDFIFAIVCEELGFIIAALILILFGVLVWRGIYISQRSGDTFGKLLGCGLSAQIALQVILNILVITDWLPNTGISLPFFSYGGSSLVMLLAQMGVVLSVSRTSKIEKV
ncbi:MAG: cell division protein FtsW [Ruminococcaceae bacterium]|nr:cell division protein FtsW [Oscillospiraceae bacterium]